MIKVAKAIKKIPRWLISLGMLISFVVFILSAPSRIDGILEIFAFASFVIFVALAMYRVTVGDIRDIITTQSCPTCKGTGRVKKESNSGA